MVALKNPFIYFSYGNKTDAAEYLQNLTNTKVGIDRRIFLLALNNPS